MEKEKITRIAASIIAILIILIIIVSIIENSKINTQLFDLTENEPLKQLYIRNQEHFREDILPKSGITEEEYKNFLENPEDYIVYSLRCKIENKSDKELTAKYEMNKENMWIDIVTMSNTNEVINKNSSTNKSISILIKMNGKNKEEIQSEVEKINITIHLFESNNPEKEVKKVNAKF